jgi:hypothetical protein
MAIGNKCQSIDSFMKSCTEIRTKVEADKLEYKAKKKQLAVTNPQE